ncbi:hypothetical protein U1Q18_028569 [Sarracenia purpurea var. burkii]
MPQNGPPPQEKDAKVGKWVKLEARIPNQLRPTAALKPQRCSRPVGSNQQSNATGSSK